MNRLITKLTAGLLVVSFSCLCVPESLRTALADEIQAQSLNSSVEDDREITRDELAYVTPEKDEPYILYENRNLRSRFGKVFSLSDGTILSTQYSTPIHYFNGSTEQYEEIDNTLIKVSDNNTEYYQNAANDFDLKLYTTTSGDHDLVEISKGEYRISFSPVRSIEKAEKTFAEHGGLSLVSNESSGIINEDIKLNKVEGISSGTRPETDYTHGEYTQSQFVPSAIGSAVYHSPNGTSFKFSVHSSYIKEEIVISHSLSPNSYLFKLNLTDASAVAEDDGSISFYTENNDELLRLEAPVLTDPDGKVAGIAESTVIGSDHGCYLQISFDEKILSDHETAFPLSISTKLLFDSDTYSDEAALIQSGDAAVLDLHNAPLPSYYSVTSASLKYSYKADTEHSAFEVYPVSDMEWESADKFIPASDTTSKAEESAALRANKVYTQVKEIEINKIRDGGIRMGFKPVSASGNFTLYSEGAEAAVLSVQAYLNVGLNPNAVTEQFEGIDTVNHVNVYTGKLTSVVDFMSVNSNYMPIQLQMVYNPDYDAYKEDHRTSNPMFFEDCFGKNFKLNLEQYCFSYNFGDPHHDGMIYIDGSGAVHQFRRAVRSGNGGVHYVCDDCNLTCVSLSTSRFTIYKNDYPYMYFESNCLKWIATSNKCLRIAYEHVDGEMRVKRVYNCLEGGTYSSPSNEEAQSVTFSYNSNDLLASVTSNYGDTVSFTYDSSRRLKKMTRSGLTLASFGYDSNGRLDEVIDRNDLGYQFEFSSGSSINEVYGLNTDGTNTSSISKVTFLSSGRTKKVNIITADQETAVHEYGFDQSGKCESSYSGYSNDRDEDTPRNSIALYSKQEADEERTNIAFSYTEDFSQIENGTFESVSGNSPSGWSVSTAYAGNHYISDGGSNRLFLRANSSASRSYSFTNHYKTYYVLGFYANTSGLDCQLKVTLSGNVFSETFDISSYGQYYAAIVFEPHELSGSGTITLKNLSPSYSVKIDNVTLSPIDTYIEETWNSFEMVRNTKQISGDRTYTSTVDKDNQLQEETYTIHSTGTEITKTNTYTADKLYLDQTVTTVNYTDNGTEKTETQTVEKVSTANYSESTTTYVGADGTTLKTFSSVDTDLFGFPVREIGPNGEKVYYYYENVQKNYRLTKVISCAYTSTAAVGESHDTHTNDLILTYTYNTYGECISVSDGEHTNSVTDYHDGGAALYSGSGQSWKTDVNVFGNPTSIYEVGNSLKQIQYTYDSAQNLTRATYNHSASEQSYAEYTYDEYGSVTSETWYEKSGSAAAVNTAEYSMTYDYSDHTQTIESDGVSYVYQANYNNSPLKGKITVSGNDYSADYVYSARSDGLLAGSVYTFDNFGSGLTRTYTPTYNSKNQIVSETDGDFKAQYTYDAMGRMEIYEIHHGSRRVLTGQVYYGSNAVSGVRYTTNMVTGSSSDKSYGFDMLGRVNRIYWDRTTTDMINYDRYDRVSSYQIGGYNGTWYSYQYDDNNNLIQIGKRTPNGPPVTMPYIDFTYNSKNQLITYEVDNTTKYYSYDNLGNPVKYGVSSQSAAENMVWTQGTKLASGNYKGNSFSYKYDANGLRYEKTVNGITTRQYLEGDKIIAEEILNASGSVAHTKYYIYDQTGIAGMVYDGESYYFGKNIFGDVTTIYDCYGNWEAGYEYDLWGNITSGGSSGIAKENPFRYRGYYYDSETGFYYLQSRYYDPEICRFINADNLELLSTLSGTPGQLNLYAYCNNNPVMYSDPSGEGIISIIIFLGIMTIAGGAIGGVVSYNEAIAAGKTGNELIKSVLIGISIGSAIGLAAGGASVMLGSVISGALAGIKLTSGMFMGVTSMQSFSIGALAFNFTAFVISPLLGWEMQGVDFNLPSNPYQPEKPYPIPKHPYFGR